MSILPKKRNQKHTRNNAHAGKHPLPYIGTLFKNKIGAYNFKHIDNPTQSTHIGHYGKRKRKIKKYKRHKMKCPNDKKTTQALCGKL